MAGDAVGAKLIIGVPELVVGSALLLRLLLLLLPLPVPATPATEGKGRENLLKNGRAEEEEVLTAGEGELGADDDDTAAYGSVVAVDVAAAEFGVAVVEVLERLGSLSFMLLKKAGILPATAAEEVDADAGVALVEERFWDVRFDVWPEGLDDADDAPSCCCCI